VTVYLKVWKIPATHTQKLQSACTYTVIDINKGQKGPYCRKRKTKLATYGIIAVKVKAIVTDLISEFQNLRAS
jgi:hypothetical protein